MAGDEAVEDVGVAGDERFDDGRAFAAEDDDSAVYRVGEGSGEDDFAAVGEFAYEAEVGIAEGCAEGDDVIDVVVEECVEHPPILSAGVLKFCSAGFALSLGFLGAAGA